MPVRGLSFSPVVADKKTQAPSFEAALSQLESIVEAMETGDVPLADLMAQFEDGTKLLKICEARLKEAELKIELLKKQADGASFAPFVSPSES